MGMDFQHFLMDREEIFMSHLRIGPLVRATSTDTVVIWAELSEHCDVQLLIIPDDRVTETTISVSATTVQVGGHYYIAPQVGGLQPSSWYTYSLSLPAENTELTTKDNSTLIQCFRTFDAHTIDSDDKRPGLRLAYGSCRKAEQDPSDALPAFGTWLSQHYTRREELWPHLLLFIGDQIYADQPPAEIVASHPHLQQGAQTFEDFCILYAHAWTCDAAVQQALAAIPTFMIFDDHEIKNNWNVEATWQSTFIRQGNEQLLIDGLVAYWVYQGWGNLIQEATTKHPLLTVMLAAAQSGEDALEKLRDCIRADIYKLTSIRWHYCIPTQPSIFVSNARTERTTILDQNPVEIYGPTRIMSQEQMQDIEQWLQPQQQEFPIFVSSVPVLLPPLIGLLQYLTGERVWLTGPYPLRWLGRKLAHFQKSVAARVGFDHWPLYTTTWHEFLRLIEQKQQDIIILGGDVHFSYSLAAVSTTTHRRQQQGMQQTDAHLYQFVSTPIQNTLGDESESKVKMQAFITKIAYSGLHLHMLPLKVMDAKARVQGHLLFENTLAFLTLQPMPGNTYQIKHEYMTSIDGEMKVVGFTELPVK